MIHYSECPVCNSEKIRFVLKARDYTVSGEFFEIWECDFCTLRFTQDVPNEEAIGRYYQSEDYISHSGTKKGLVNKLYHIVRSRALQGKRKLIEKTTNLIKGNILDIGAGTGEFLQIMQQHGWMVKGLEPDEKARQHSLRQYNFILDPPDNLYELIENSFDVITMWHVLEHVHALNKNVSRIYELLKPEGVLFVAVPNYTSPDAKSYKSQWAAYDVPRHLYHFSPQSMTLLMEKHGFYISKIIPMKFDSYYVSMLSEKYKKTRMGFWKGGLNGLLSNLSASRKKNNYSSEIYVIRKLSITNSQ